MLRSAAAPESVETVLALTVPEVLLSRVLRTDAASEVSVRVTSSLLSPEMPLEA